MILADTSIWIDHLRTSNTILVDLLGNSQVLVHRFVIGEIAMGSLSNRPQIISLLSALPEVSAAEHGEILHLVERHKLYGLGIGYVDAHLLAASLLTPGTMLWTGDKRLASIAARMGIGFRAVS